MQTMRSQAETRLLQPNKRPKKRKMLPSLLGVADVETNAASRAEVVSSEVVQTKEVARTNAEDPVSVAVDSRQLEDTAISLALVEAAAGQAQHKTRPSGYTSCSI